jgi:protein-disulfide isomerase
MLIELLYDIIVTIMNDTTPKSEKLMLPVSIIIAGLLIGGGVYLNGRITKQNPTPTQQQQLKSENLSNTLRPIDANDHVLGSANARVVVVEYSDKNKKKD